MMLSKNRSVTRVSVSRSVNAELDLTAVASESDSLCRGRASVKRALHLAVIDHLNSSRARAGVGRDHRELGLPAAPFEVQRQPTPEPRALDAARGPLAW